MVVVWRTDVHQSDRGPRSRLDDWTETVDNKLAQVGRVALEENAAAVLDGGDFFHNPVPSRSSHSLVRRTASLHAAHYHCPVVANLGNHDVRFGDIRYLSESPLGVLFAAGVFVPCFEGDGVILERGGVRARVAGVAYRPSGLDRDRLRSLRPATGEHLLVLLHIAASPQGGRFPEGEEIVSYQEIVELCPSASAVFIGHWHKDQGASRVGNTWIVNCGSLTRGSLADDDLVRSPKIAVVRLGGPGEVSVELRPIQVAAPESVFDLRGKQAQRAKTEGADRATRLAHMFDGLRSTGSGRSIEDQVREQPDLRPEVKHRILDALARGRGNVRDLASRPE